MNLEKFLPKALSPIYRRAKRKRAMERRLRAQGWSRREACAAVASKYRGRRS
jgi:hypothetical protein